MSAPLKKSIHFFELTMIAVGASIGAGIFISPSDVAAQLTEGWQIILVWIIGGIVTITGALTFGELAARYPGTGGVYVYLRKAYGDLAAFLYGWSILTVITSGAIAALCLAFARYFAIIFELPASLQVPCGLTVLLLVTLINIIGVRISAVFSSTVTFLKVVGIGLVILVCFIAGDLLVPNLTMDQGLTFPATFGVALVGVLWSYGGWHHASYVSGEVVNAQKIVPRALVLGGVIVTVVYVAVNSAYLSVMTRSEIASSSAVAADALLKVTAVGGILIAIMIAFSTLGTAGIFTLSTPRIYYKMGEDKLFFPWLADLHPKFATPVKAILLQSTWAGVLMLFWGTFENLATYVVFMDWIFMTMAAVGLFFFRNKKESSPHTGYKVPLYPIIPLIFIGISVWFLVSTIIGRPVQAMAGLFLMTIGLPVFIFFKKKMNA